MIKNNNDYLLVSLKESGRFPSKEWVKRKKFVPLYTEKISKNLTFMCLYFHTTP